MHRDIDMVTLLSNKLALSLATRHCFPSPSYCSGPYHSDPSCLPTPALPLNSRLANTSGQEQDPFSAESAVSAAETALAMVELSAKISAHHIVRSKLAFASLMEDPEEGRRPSPKQGCSTKRTPQRRGERCPQPAGLHSKGALEEWAALEENQDLQVLRSRMALRPIGETMSFLSFKRLASEVCPRLVSPTDEWCLWFLREHQLLHQVDVPFQE